MPNEFEDITEFRGRDEDGITIMSVYDFLWNENGMKL